MNGEQPRRIEIFQPFGEAWELTRKILFTPFRIEKWLVIGFAAFLANFVVGFGGGGGGGGVPDPSLFGGRGERGTDFQIPEEMKAWFSWMSVQVVIGVAVALIAFVLVLYWLGARGQFIFTDCIVRNRGAIVEPWRTYWREGNSFFLFLLAVIGAALLAAAIFIGPALVLAFQQEGDLRGSFWFVLTTGVVLLILFALALMIFTQFVVPIMYCRRCDAWQALRENYRLVLERPGPIVLYFLFVIVLGIAVGMIHCLAMCVTCCIAAIPYVGTVLLLPLHVFIYSYKLLFLRQFGPAYDAWASVSASPPPSPPPSALPPSIPA